jgi:RimJ/RimL family protein N-acetyltransferase
MTTYFAPERYETADFVLRSYQPGDGAMVNEAVNSSYDHLKTFLPWAKPHFDIEEHEAFVRESRARYLLSERFTIGIFSPDGKRVLGGTGYHIRNGYQFHDRTAEIGMWIRADESGMGLGTRVLRAVIDWGFTVWLWEKLTWYCDVRNTASARTAERAGMLREAHLRSEILLDDGTRRDTFIYGILRDEWQARREGKTSE